MRPNTAKIHQNNVWPLRKQQNIDNCGFFLRYILPIDPCAAPPTESKQAPTNPSPAIVLCAVIGAPKTTLPQLHFSSQSYTDWDSEGFLERLWDGRKMATNTMNLDRDSACWSLASACGQPCFLAYLQIDKLQQLKMALGKPIWNYYLFELEKNLQNENCCISVLDIFI